MPDRFAPGCTILGRGRPPTGGGNANGSLSLEAIARTAHRADRVDAPSLQQRLAQSADVHIDRALVDVHIVTPHPVEQLAAGKDPPRRLHLEVIRGSFQLFGTGAMGESTVPRIVAQPRTPVGLIWFQRMDRNNDGDLTWKEFLGPRHVFDELDADHDGLIDPREAEKARP